MLRSLRSLLACVVTFFSFQAEIQHTAKHTLVCFRLLLLTFFLQVFLQNRNALISKPPGFGLATLATLELLESQAACWQAVMLVLHVTVSTGASVAFVSCKKLNELCHCLGDRFMSYVPAHPSSALMHQSDLSA